MSVTTMTTTTTHVTAMYTTAQYAVGAPSGKDFGKATGAADVLALAARPVRALAMFYDGTAAGGAAVRRWIHDLRSSAEVEQINAGGVLTVSEPCGAEQVQLRPGSFLIFVQGGPSWWSAASPGQLITWLERRPRELPIFPDGEVVP